MKHFYIITVLFLSFSFIATAQDDIDPEADMALEDSTYIKKKNYPQQYDYENNQYPFPAKKKNMWALGVQVGQAWVSGDVRAKKNSSYVLGLTVQKALGHVFSLRFQGTYGKMMGQDWKPVTSGTEKTYRNYMTIFSDYSLQAVFALNNIHFYKRQPKVILYGFGGFGVSTRFTKLDQQGADNLDYDYSSVPNPGDADKSDILQQIRDIQDGTFETRLPLQDGDESWGNTKINPSISVGAGISFRLSRRIDLNLEYRFSWHEDDFYDGSNTTREGTDSRNKDFVNYGNFTFVVKIGKRQEPLWWVNPLTTPYTDIQELKAEIEDGAFKTDTDEDGVADLFDQELNTPPNVDVDSKGRTLDSDKDGIPDHLDNDPFTTKGAPINRDGSPLDSDRDGVPDIFDQEPNSKEGALVDAKGIDIRYADIADETVLANIYFETNSSQIQEHHYPDLYNVAKFLEENPSAALYVEGHSDQIGSDDYNTNLSEKRAENAVNYLINSFGVDEERLKIKAVGKADPLVPDLPAKYTNDSNGGHYMNRRVSFTVAE